MSIWAGNDDFWWFFKICSNHHKWSSKVCRSILGVQRSHFRPYITFPATSGQMIGHNANHQKSAKIAKIAILTKNSNFFKVAGSVRKMDIWPEMGPWGVLEPFCTRNRYLKSFRSNFKSFWKNRFFWLFHLWDHPKYGRRIFYGSRIFDIEISTGPNISYLFPNQNGVEYWP